MSDRVQVLDHGYIELVEHWGSDESIITAARMSTGKGFLGWEPGPCPTCEGRGTFNLLLCGSCEGKGTISGDAKLLRYLWTEKPQHSTPFEMCGAVFEVGAPIMCFREWHRHRVPFSYNEMSGRYTALPNVNYVPSVDRLLVGGDGKNKQAGTIKDAEMLDEAGAEEYRRELAEEWKRQEEFYQRWLYRGVPKELARMHVGVGRYSRMRASANLRGWLAFVTLRSHKKAQREIRQYSDAVFSFLQERFPRTAALFIEDKMVAAYPGIGTKEVAG